MYGVILEHVRVPLKSYSSLYWTNSFLLLKLLTANISGTRSQHLRKFRCCQIFYSNSFQIHMEINKRSFCVENLHHCEKMKHTLFVLQNETVQRFYPAELRGIVVPWNSCFWKELCQISILERMHF